MSSSSDPTNVPPSPPESLDSKFLSRFSDTDSLFVRPTISVNQQKSPSIALERFQQLEQEIRNAPANPAPYVELGQIYLNQERFADAKRVLDGGVSCCPEHEPLLLMREDLLLHQAGKLVDQAKKELAQEQTSEKKYALEQAEINFANERIRVCRDRFTRHPDQTDLLINWAIGVRQLARFEEAAELLIKASEDIDFRARANLQLGICYQTLNRNLEALSAYRKAALFRDPPPEPQVRQKALELAIELASKLSLIDSARFYTEQLLLDCEPSKRSLLEKSLQHLAALEL